MLTGHGRSETDVLTEHCRCEADVELAEVRQTTKTLTRAATQVKKSSKVFMAFMFDGRQTTFDYEGQWSVFPNSTNISIPSPYSIC